MADEVPVVSNPKMRGARPSPRHKLLSCHPHMPVGAPPAQFAVVPGQLSMWGNSQYGDCVSAQEAYSKAAYSVQCGLPETFITEQEVIRWARQYGFLNGADLPEVMDQMAKNGMNANGINYKDGPYSGVDYSNETVLQSAITVGPVNIAIDADALPNDAGNKMGWYSLKGGRFPNTDHCVALSGYGTAGFCFGKLGVPVPAGVDPNTPSCYLLFTWNTIGVVSHAWLMGTCTEAWVRNPTTPGQSPTPPAPPVPPTPPTPPTPPGPNPMPAGLYALTMNMDGSMLFTPHTAGPISITPATTVQQLIDAMGTGNEMAFPPFIVNLLKFICPFAAILPPPIGPILVAICAMLPHATPRADGTLVIKVSAELANQINALRSSPRVTLPDFGAKAQVIEFEDWLRGQSSFRCAGCQ